MFALTNGLDKLKNDTNKINRPMMVILKDRFVPPLPKVPTCHYKDRLPFLLVCSTLLMGEVIEDLVPAIQRKETSNMI